MGYMCTSSYDPYRSVSYQSHIPRKCAGSWSHFNVRNSPKVNCVIQVDFDESVVLHRVVCTYHPSTTLILTLVCKLRRFKRKFWGVV